MRLKQKEWDELNARLARMWAEHALTAALTEEEEALVARLERTPRGNSEGKPSSPA